VKCRTTSSGWQAKKKKHSDPIKQLQNFHQGEVELIELISPEQGLGWVVVAEKATKPRPPAQKTHCLHRFSFFILANDKQGN
jgi:hypothetical protein